MNIFLEAETFASLGGWTIDTQSRETMGGFYLLAHGIGKPVEDAETSLSIVQGGRYHCFVRTRNWSGVWHRGTPAGRFLVKIDGTALPTELGTESTAWAWQRAGTITLAPGTHSVALHDLTGFDGRCDALYLTDDPTELPPDGGAELANFRRKHCHTVIEEDGTDYDLIICGGGYAALCAGMTAKMLGLKFLIIQDRSVVGGCSSSEIRVWVGGDTHLGKYPALGMPAVLLSPLQGLPNMKKDVELFEDYRKKSFFKEGSELLLNEAVLYPECINGKIISVVTRSIRTGREFRRHASFFADCTGDALLARLSGCETMYGSEGRDVFHESLAPEKTQRTVMGHSVLWETHERDHAVSFPDINWGIEFSEATVMKRFNCCWDWEAGQFRDQILEYEEIRDYGLMSCYANWSFLKNHSAEREKWANMDLGWVSAIGGKRESCRVVGDLILTQNDLLNHLYHEDGTASASWSIDIHYPDPENLQNFKEPFQSCAYHYGLGAPYEIPYRCLYARDCANLFLGGRCLSASHIAFSSIRVMRTLGMLGEVIAMAASICVRKKCSCRDVYAFYLPELQTMMTKGTLVLLPCAWGCGQMEGFHFMRPTGTYGNENENCWVYYDEKGRPRQPIHPDLQKNIDALGIDRESLSSTSPKT